jgi:ubiquinone/menaquinone biosynthesis C-methylase UbiE
LAEALLGAAGGTGTLLEFVETSAAANLEVLEINQAGSLNPVLARLPRHRLASYPAVDMQAMPYPDGSFDLVVHSDTLEHVLDPLRALSECRRVLRPTGALCFTVPVIVGRLTRSCAGRQPSFHGMPAAESEDLHVHT